MRTKYKILAALAGLPLLFTSCDDGDAVVDFVTENTTRGAVLRTIEITENVILTDNPDGAFSATFEVQDQQDGDLVEEVEVYARYVDQTSSDGPGNSEEAFVETISSDSFETGPFGLPRFSYDITLGQMLSATGVSQDAINGTDEFRIRFELVLSDGRRFSFEDNTNTITGSFFSSPFQYTALLACPPSTPTPGTWTIELQDSYGDGWNGASLDVTIDGETTSYTLADGDAATETFTVPDGAAVIAIVYRSGAWDSEVTFQVISANGNEVLDLGPNPPADIQLLDYCPDNL
ncbi:hypothetical protein [Robertkochia aurantiaca]|uniref:hypothetical protein n=1 Tax=Robertkochia aurantiaca TaxID=2873700 RepID=UPI001CCB60A2|nr:hypothetical protein [Robertkochia sp. 3YJGBD-33]